MIRVLTVPRVALLAALGFALAVPYVLRGYYVSIIALAFIAGLLAASVNMLAGQLHLVSVGHAGIAAGAAYAVAWSSQHGHGYATQLALALAVTLLISAGYGLTSMRTSGIFFLMVTLALGMVVFGLTYRLSRVTGGENGLTGIWRPPFVTDMWQFYYLCLAVLVLAVLALWVIERSSYGLVLRGIRESESRMSSLGYSVAGYKFSAMMISGLVAGIAGVLSVWHAEFVSPTSAGFLRSALTVIMVILGGVGTWLGPLIGAGVVTGTEHLLSSYVERWPTVLGLIFILVVLFAPNGLVGAARSLHRRLRRPRGAHSAGRGRPPRAGEPGTGTGSASPASSSTTGSTGSSPN